MRQFLLAVSGALVVLIPGVSPVQAQPTLDRILSGVKVRDGDNCAVVQIDFNAPTRYLSRFPLDVGDQLSIRLGPVSGVSLPSLNRESLKPPASTIATVTDIEYDSTGGNGPTLSIQFSRRVFFNVDQGGDFRSIVLTIGTDKPATSCPATQASATPEIKSTPPTSTAPVKSVLSSTPATAEAQKLLGDARTAMTASSYGDAIALLTKFLQLPENSSSPDAQEMLGIARERNGQLAHAKAEYDAYLQRYPNGEAADRVRQRLATMLTRALKTPERQAAATGETGNAQWSFNGSLSEYYYHDEMSTVIHDDTTLVTIDNGLTALQSQLVSAFDGSLEMNTGDYEGAIRASLAYTKDFIDSHNDRTSITSLYLEGGTANRAYYVRVGRQYRNTGGIFGRVDGILASARLTDMFRLELIGGYPVDSSWSSFQTHREAYGGALLFSAGAWGGDFYLLRQTDQGLVDRQAVGLEAHYVGAKTSIFSTFDYDLHFGEVNIALVNANFILDDQTTINLAGDYRRSPILRTSDALIGQTVPTLQDLLSTYTLREIQQLALDRTSKSTSFFASVTHPFNEKYSVGFDATFWDMSGAPASGGVPAQPAIGLETYYSARLIGTGLLTEGDLGMLSVGYANAYHANRYTFDLSTRYPVTPEFRVGPRVFVGYRRATDSDATQLSIRPTLRFNYRMRSNVEFELEAGAEYEKDHLLSTTTTMWNVLVTAGIRVDF